MHLHPYTPQVRDEGTKRLQLSAGGAANSFPRCDFLSFPWVSRRHPAILPLCTSAEDSYPQPRVSVQDVAALHEMPTRRTCSARVSGHPAVAANRDGSSCVASGCPARFRGTLRSQGLVKPGYGVLARNEGRQSQLIPKENRPQLILEIRFRMKPAALSSD